MAHLTLHRGAELVARDALFGAILNDMPEATRSWQPIPHATLLTGVTSALERSGLRVISEEHALAAGGMRYFGTLSVAPIVTSEAKPDYALAVGLRNAHDKKFNAGLAVGSRVFVCDNLAFSSEIVIGRKHTVHILRDLPALIESAVGRIPDLRGRQDHRIASYKATEVSDARAHDLVVQSLDARILGCTMIPDVIREWREPRHPEFAPRNAWSLFNAFTEVLKRRNRFAIQRTTQALHGLVDTACGVLA